MNTVEELSAVKRDTFKYEALGGTCVTFSESYFVTKAILVDAEVGPQGSTWLSWSRCQMGG